MAGIIVIGKGRGRDGRGREEGDGRGRKGKGREERGAPGRIGSGRDGSHIFAGR